MNCWTNKKSPNESDNGMSSPSSSNLSIWIHLTIFFTLNNVSLFVRNESSEQEINLSWTFDKNFKIFFFNFSSFHHYHQILQILMMEKISFCVMLSKNFYFYPAIYIIIINLSSIPWRFRLIFKFHFCFYFMLINCRRSLWPFVFIAIYMWILFCGRKMKRKKIFF